MVGPARVRLSLLYDATQLRSAESGYYGLIHYERKGGVAYKLPDTGTGNNIWTVDQLAVDEEAN